MNFDRVLRWLRRRPFYLYSSLTAERALDVLSENVAPIPSFAFGWVTGGTPHKGRITGSRVRLMNHTGNRNSWRTVFDGSVEPTESGSVLTGTIGPVAFVPIFSAIWLGGVTLFFLGGAIGTLVDLVSGHGLTVLPLLLIPGAMLVFFLALNEFAGRAASNEWASMERWLGDLLNP